MKQTIAIQIIYAMLVFLWVYAACSKLFSYNQFTIQLGNSPFISSYAAEISWLVPGVELMIAALLAIMRTRLLGLYASFALLMIFTLYIAAMLLSGTRIPCSCGGVINSLSWKQHLVFNLAFIALSVVGIIMWWKQRQAILLNDKNISRE